jgi:anti-anti-sigma regulatory factor
MSEVTVLTSSGIGLLIATNENATFGRLHLVGVHDNRSVQRPLASAGLLGLFDVFPDLETLLARLRTAEPVSDGPRR